MNKKNIMPFFIIILLVYNLSIVNSKVNDKKIKTSEETTTLEQNGKGLAKGKPSRNSPDNSEPIYAEPSVDVNLDVYFDYACLIPASSVDWGEVELGGSKSISLYIKNNGNVDSFAVLSSENWNPEYAVEYLQLSWDYDGVSMSPGQIVPVKLTLDVGLECPFDCFSFNIVIIGS